MKDITIKVPEWASEVKHEGTLVLIWLIRHVYTKYGAGMKYNMYVSDVNTILGESKDFRTFLRKECPPINDHIKLANYGTGKHTFIINVPGREQLVEMTLTEERAKCIWLYLNGVTNHNLLEDVPQKNLTLNAQLNDVFRYQVWGERG